VKKILGSWLFAIFMCWLSIVTMGYAATWGGIWDCKENPKQNVTVGLESGEEVTGTLSCNWDKSRVIDVPEKGKIVFTKFNYMAWKMPEDHLNENSSIFFPKFWRSLLPPFLVMVILTFSYVYLIIYLKRETPPVNHDVQ